MVHTTVKSPFAHRTRKNGAPGCRLFPKPVPSKYNEQKRNGRNTPMMEQLTRLKESRLPVICKVCRNEFRGAEASQHTIDTDHKDFYPKPASFATQGRTR